MRNDNASQHILLARLIALETAFAQFRLTTDEALGDLQQTVVRLQEVLGTMPQGDHASVRARLDAIEPACASDSGH
jgi:hypothetical protein